MGLGVDARGLAVAGTEFASVALRDIEPRLEEREARQRPEQRPDRADRIAPRASVAPGQHEEENEGCGSDDQRCEPLHPDIDRIEGIAVNPFGRPCQQVVAPAPERSQQALDNASVGAVRGDQGPDASEPGRHDDDKEKEYAPAQPRAGGGVAEAVAMPAPPPGEPRDEVLHDAERTDHRAVDAPEEQRQEEESGNHTDVQGQHGGQELNLRHPAEPRMDRPREVEKQQRDRNEEEDSQGDPDFSQHGYYRVSLCVDRASACGLRSAAANPGSVKLTKISARSGFLRVKSGLPAGKNYRTMRPGAVRAGTARAGAGAPCNETAPRNETEHTTLRKRNAPRNENGTHPRNKNGTDPRPPRPIPEKTAYRSDSARTSFVSFLPTSNSLMFNIVMRAILSSASRVKKP